MANHEAENVVPSGDAWFDETGCYRYLLRRRFADGLAEGLVFVLLNPSTADASTDDPTTRRLGGFARAWGFGGYDLVNLFSLRTKDPKQLAVARDPVGPEGDRILLEFARRASLLVFGWGNGGRLCGRSEKVRQLLAGSRADCVGQTRWGEPRRPLYVPSTAPRQAFLSSEV